MSEIYLKPILKQDTECIHESRSQNDIRKRFEDWLNSLKPVDYDPETEMRMLSETIKNVKILNDSRIGW